MSARPFEIGFAQPPGRGRRIGNPSGRENRGFSAAGRLGETILSVAARRHSRRTMQKKHHFMRTNRNCHARNEVLIRRGFLAALLSASSALAMGSRVAAPAPRPIRVVAAADLKFALGELVTQYQVQTGIPVQLSLGSSGHFAQQIRQGLPADLYLSADEAYVLQLADAGLTLDRGAIYAHGRLAVVVPAASPVALEPALRPLRNALPTMRAFAIANPAHAPYGRAARQALERLGWWELVRPRLVLGENVAQATQFVTSGAAECGIVALSLAIAPEVARLTRSLPLPTELHEPMRQRMVLLRSARAGAEGLYRFLLSPPARAVLQRYGFSPA